MERMRKSAAATGTAAFFVAAPGVVAGVVPYALTEWHAGDPPGALALRLVGGVFVGLGTVVLVHAFVRFVVEGSGTPAPVAPTERLVVGGLYRYVRNPMYVAVVSCVVGQALLLGRTVLLVYGAAIAAVFALFVRFYEEPVLAARYGSAYDEYRRHVPGWRPRLRPWAPDDPA